MKSKTLAGIVLIASLSGGSAFAQVRINAAGATFPYPIYSKWFAEYAKAKGTEINYQSIGSGGGINMLTSGTVDFGASDMPLTDAQIGKMAAKPLAFPTVLGAVVPIYNLAGNPDLKFTGQTLADIFIGKVTKWNDTALKAANPGVNLPDADIVVVHRSETSGTTFVFTDYLEKASPESKAVLGPANTAVNWKVGIAGKGSEGVTGLVKQTPNSIGYVELIYALQNKLGYGAVKNSAGKFLKADLAGVTAAAAAGAKSMPDDFRVSITNAPGPAAYPISTFTWLLIPSEFKDSAKRDAIKDFLHWMLTKGQTYNEALGYAKLPAPVIAKEEKQIDEIK